MQNQNTITFEQKVANNLGERIGVLTVDLEITYAERDLLRQELNQANNRISQLEEQLKNTDVAEPQNNTQE
ncbi:hypothetical protein SAMN05421503_1416 [Terribacillus aidingensis]|uniref:Uncharacterized protein n=1 Tax=Terribacillus aidingensis TaxID=586416 RepID=A0A285NKE8_9BACI|nr:hypothetical protein [Terribacillus aidingensis]SNZ09915.1 hypothetical protein SAMN05421503_1416 [Terribacillus aidingensis]